MKDTLSQNIFVNPYQQQQQRFVLRVISCHHVVKQGGLHWKSREWHRICFQYDVTRTEDELPARFNKEEEFSPYFAQDESGAESW
jgi:hypothetical protein